LGIGDWGLGIGDWEFGIEDWEFKIKIFILFNNKKIIYFFNLNLNKKNKLNKK
jgi:hypothetical protein